MPMVIVGNKCDLKRSLPFEEIEATVNLDWEAGYVECSAIAQHKEKVEEIFMELHRQYNRIVRLEEKCSDEVFEVEKKKPMKILKKLLSRENFDLVKRKSSSDMLQRETCIKS